MNTSTHFIRFAKPMAIALALAVLVVPAAYGGTPERTNAILRNDIAHFGNDSGLSAQKRPNVLLRNDIAHFESTRSAAPAPVIVSVDRGFDWASAGVGAASGLGLLIALAGVAAAIRTRQRGHEALS